jgi:hypothetical protein
MNYAECERAEIRVRVDRVKIGDDGAKNSGPGD